MRFSSSKSVFNIVQLDCLLKLQCFQDYEMHNKYQVLGYIVFRDKKSIDLMPKLGQSFFISAPVIEAQPGGPGLDDIKHLLDSTDRDETFEFQSASSLNTKGSRKRRYIGAKIGPAGIHFL